jgi:DNA gyrase subunit A
LGELVKKYGDARRTELSNVEIPKEEKEIQYVEPEKCVVVMTEGGLIKRVPTASFRTQKRNGKGVKTQDDITHAIIRTNTIDSLMIFSNKGVMYRLLVDLIPSGTNTAKGVPVKSLIQMADDEEPAVIYSIYRDTDAKYVLFVTKNGLVKKTTLDEYTSTKKKTGIAAINIKDGDELVAVSLVKDEDVILATAGGYCIRFNTMEIGATSRNTSGVKGINLGAEDYIIAAAPVRDTTDQLAVFSKIGLGKRVSLSDLPTQKRGGKGLMCYKNELIADIALVNDSDNLLLVGNNTSICISASELPSIGRAGAGNGMIKTQNLISVSKV